MICKKNRLQQHKTIICDLNSYLCTQIEVLLFSYSQTFMHFDGDDISFGA